MKRSFSLKEARDIGKQIGLDFSVVSADEFRQGLAVELEHGAHDPETNVTNDDLLATGKIAWAHLKEIPDYYTRLVAMEQAAENPSSEEAPKRLYLSTDKKISGVCGGIGEYFGVDSTLIRLAWIIATVLTGIVPGVVAYIVAALVIPHKPVQ